MFDEDSSLLGLAGIFAILALGLVVMLKIVYFPIVWCSTGSLQAAGQMLMDSEVDEAFLRLIVSIVLLFIAINVIVS